jgi:hypothetical protein
VVAVVVLVQVGNTDGATSNTDGKGGDGTAEPFEHHRFKLELQGQVVAVVVKPHQTHCCWSWVALVGVVAQAGNVLQGICNRWNC